MTRFRIASMIARAAAALVLCSTQATAQNYGPPPTVAEAHEFLGYTFQRYAIDYAVWHGPRTDDKVRGQAESYGGRDCISEVATGSGRAFVVDWSLISGIQMSGTEAIYVRGQLVRASQGARREANFHMYFPDARVARSVTNAFEILRSSCQRRSKFD